MIDDMARSGYAEQPHWRRYLDHYPPDLRSGADPVEQWWHWRGMDVHLDRLAVPDPEVTVILLHGGGGYGRMLTPFVRLFAGEPVEVVAPDLPGYGLTVTNGVVVDHAMWVDLAADLVRAEQRGGRPVVLIGASMGGLVAYSAAARTGAAGVAATCLLDPRDPDVRRAAARVPWLGSVAQPLLRAVRRVADPVRVPIRWTVRMSAMSNQPALTRLVERDPLGGGGRVSLRFLRTFLDAAPEVEPEDFTACPVLLAHPAADRWTPVELSRAFLDRIAAPTELVLLENAGHLPVEEPGIGQLRDALLRFVRHVAA